MPIERFYIDAPLQEQTTILLEGTEFHHLVHVMRQKVGDSIEIVNGKNILAYAFIQQITKTYASLSLQSVQKENRSIGRLILAQALVKPNRLDFILEKGTELGVDAFWLFPGDLSIKKDFSINQINRAQSLTISAMKQCGRLTLPEIILQPPIKEWQHIPNLSFYGEVKVEAPLFSTFASRISHASEIMFVTGPESGFSIHEMHFLKNLNIAGIKLHPFTLRTDTASIMALSLLSHWFCNSVSL